jgi:branched-chain amino acid transport system substrate-binding protein
MRVFVILSLLLFSFPAFAQQKFKIGVSLPLTGEAAGYGEDARKALTFAAERFGENKIELVFEDDQCSGKGGLSVANKLAYIDRVQAVLGPVCSGALLTAAPVYQKEHILTFGIATSAPAISKLGSYIFRLSPNDTDSARLLAEHAILSKPGAIAVISEQTEYCEAFRKEFSSHIQLANLKIEDTVFNPGETDFKSSLLRLKSKGINNIFVNTQSEKTFLLVVQQIEQIGWKPVIYGAYWPSSSTVLATLGKKADGIEFVDMRSPSELLSSEGEHIYPEFLKKYGEPKSNPIIPPIAIEALRVAKRALEQAKPVEFLSNTEFDGIIGKFKFDENGDLMNQILVLRVIKDGKVENLSKG